MRSMLVICAVAALPLLAAYGCGNGGGGTGGQGAGGQGTGGQGGTTPQNCGTGGGYISLVAEDVCIDGTSASCALGDSLLQRACTGDMDCPQSTVCRVCDAMRSFCDATCLTDSNCWGGTCDASGHCHPKACAASGDCPKNFTCSPTESICVRKTCSHDGDCDGFCLSGRCAASKPFCNTCI